MPWNVDGDLRHDRIGEAERGREVGQLLDRVGHDARLLEAGETVRAGTNVCLEGGNAKALLVVEEEVDLSREQVAMIHERSTRQNRMGFQQKRYDFAREQGTLFQR